MGPKRRGAKTKSSKSSKPAAEILYLKDYKTLELHSIVGVKDAQEEPDVDQMLLVTFVEEKDKMEYELQSTTAYLCQNGKSLMKEFRERQRQNTKDEILKDLLQQLEQKELYIVRQRRELRKRNIRSRKLGKDRPWVVEKWAHDSDYDPTELPYDSEDDMEQETEIICGSRTPDTPEIAEGQSTDGPLNEIIETSIAEIDSQCSETADVVSKDLFGAYGLGRIRPPSSTTDDGTTLAEIGSLAKPKVQIKKTLDLGSTTDPVKSSKFSSFENLRAILSSSSTTEGTTLAEIGSSESNQTRNFGLTTVLDLNSTEFCSLALPPVLPYGNSLLPEHVEIVPMGWNFNSHSTQNLETHVAARSPAFSLNPLPSFSSVFGSIVTGMRERDSMLEQEDVDDSAMPFSLLQPGEIVDSLPNFQAFEPISVPFQNQLQPQNDPSKLYLDNAISEAQNTAVNCVQAMIIQDNPQERDDILDTLSSAKGTLNQNLLQTSSVAEPFQNQQKSTLLPLGCGSGLLEPHFIPANCANTFQLLQRNLCQHTGILPSILPADTNISIMSIPEIAEPLQNEHGYPAKFVHVKTLFSPKSLIQLAKGSEWHLPKQTQPEKLTSETITEGPVCGTSSKECPISMTSFSAIPTERRPNTAIEHAALPIVPVSPEQALPLIPVAPNPKKGPSHGNSITTPLANVDKGKAKIRGRQKKHPVKEHEIVETEEGTYYKFSDDHRRYSRPHAYFKRLKNRSQQKKRKLKKKAKAFIRNYAAILKSILVSQDYELE